MQSAAKAVTSSGRGLDVLVNNAGVGYVAPILDMDIEQAEKLYEPTRGAASGLCRPFMTCS